MRYFLVISGLMLAMSTATAMAAQSVKVLVLTAFQPETVVWLEHLENEKVIKVASAYAPVWCDLRQVCVTQTGMGENNAATSVAALLASDELDLSDAIILRTGIAGAPIDTEVTLGSAVWSDWVVAWGLGHHLLPTPQSGQQPVFIPLAGETHTEAFQLNPALVELAFNVTQDVALADNLEAKQARQRYPAQAGEKPSVTVGANLSANDFWAGAKLANLAEQIVEKRTGEQSYFATSAMEDAGDATALLRHDMLSHYLSLRTVSDFAQPPEGMTVVEMVRKAEFPGAAIALENMYRVASAFIDYVLTHPEVVQAAIASDTVERLSYPLSVEAVLDGALDDPSNEPG